MPVRNPHWYNLNESRDYPIDDSATCLSDNDDRLPPDIITDLRLSYPSLLGAYPYICAVTVTDKVVTVLIQAADTLENNDQDFVPVAAATVLRSELSRGRQYALEGLYPGVSGYITFGSGATSILYSGRFSKPSQSLLTPRAYRRYDSLPVSGTGKLYAATALTGVVLLKGEPPVEIVKDTLIIDGGWAQECIVIRLRDEYAGAGDSVFAQYAGPCAKRPESGTCGDPQPIEFLNGVPPDCDGVIELRFQGCAIVGQNTDDCSVVIDCGFGLTESCLPPFIPDSDGKLPSEYDPIVVPPEPPEPPEPETHDSISDQIIVLGELPYTDCFSDGSAVDFQVTDGQFVFVEDDSPWDPCQVHYSQSSSEVAPVPDNSYTTEGPYSAAGRNISVWDSFDVTTFYRQVTTDIKIVAGPAGCSHNGGIVINYRRHNTYLDRFVYYLAEVDYDNQEFRVRRFNGASFQTAVAVSTPGIKLDSWYRVTVQVQPYPLAPQTVAITAKLTFLDESLTVTLGPLLVNNYMPETGLFGLFANRSHTRFAYFAIAEWAGTSY